MTAEEHIKAAEGILARLEALPTGIPAATAQACATTALAHVAIADIKTKRGDTE